MLGLVILIAIVLATCIVVRLILPATGEIL